MRDYGIGLQIVGTSLDSLSRLALLNMPSPSNATQIRHLENHHTKTRRFWRAYARLVLNGQAPEYAQELGEALQRKHQQAVVLIGRMAREHNCGELIEGTRPAAEEAC